MPVGNADALICDTGALIDYLVESAPDHKRFRDAIDQARTRYTPGLVLNLHIPGGFQAHVSQSYHNRIFI